MTKEEIREGLGAGFSAGLGGGVLAHFWGGGKMTFPIFLFVSIFILGKLKGWGKIIGLVIFIAIASLILVVLKQLNLKL